MAQVKCKNCSEHILSSATNCQHCGAEVRKNNSKASDGFIGFLTLLFVGFIVFQCLGGDSSDDAPDSKAIDAKTAEREEASFLDTLDIPASRSFRFSVSTPSGATVNSLVSLVKINGYRCDSLDNARSNLLSSGFSLSCNGYKYQYNIEDRGGRYVVTVE